MNKVFIKSEAETTVDFMIEDILESAGFSDVNLECITLVYPNYHDTDDNYETLGVRCELDDYGKQKLSVSVIRDKRSNKLYKIVA